MAKMTKYQKAKAIALGSFVVPLTAGIMLSGAAIHNELSNHGSHPTEPLSDTLKKSGIVAVSDYEEKVKQQSDELYEQLQDKEINSHQFSVRYNQLHSNDALEDWAQTSTHPQVQEIVEDYNTKANKAKDDIDKTSKLFAASALSLTIGALGAAYAENVYLAIKNKHEQKNLTPLPDPKGKKPSKNNMDEFLNKNEESDEFYK